MTGSTLTDVMDECEELLSSTVNHYLKRNVRKFFKEREMLEEPGVVELLQEFELDSPFEGLRSLSQQIGTLRSYCNYIDAKEIPLDKRTDSGLNRETGTFVPKTVMDTCQYVSVIDVLTLVLSNERVKEAILTEESSEEGVLASFMDGQNFKTHEFLQRYKHAIRLELYYDDVEFANALGSKTVIHKMGVWLYRIQNMPSHMNSEVGQHSRFMSML